MILEFKVKNFLSFKDEQSINFEATSDKTYEDVYCFEVKPGLKLLKIGAIYGANASGKTNLLNALDFLQRTILFPKRDRSMNLNFVPFLLDEESFNKPGEFYLSFFLEGIKYIYTLKMDNKNIYEEKLIYYPGQRQALFFKRKLNDNKSEIEFGNTLSLNKNDEIILKGNTINNTSVIAAYSISNIKSDEFVKIYNWFKNNFMMIVKPETNLWGWTSARVEKFESCKTIILELLNKADFNISDLKFSEKNLNLPEEILKEIIEDENIPMEQKKELLEKKIIKQKSIEFIHSVGNLKKVLPLALESKGTKRYFGLGGVLNKAFENNSFLMIDELESSLHFELMAHFLKTFLVNTKNSQLLFTTHNIAILDEDLFRRDSIWFTEKKEDASTELFSAIDVGLHKNISIYNAYKIGKFGAKPNLGDIYLNR